MSLRHSLAHLDHLAGFCGLHPKALKLLCPERELAGWLGADSESICLLSGRVDREPKRGKCHMGEDGLWKAR